MKDIEIARSIKLDKITDVANGIGIMEDEIEQYGNYKAKLDNEAIANRLKEKKDGKLILVTSINPTPLGEGKTTIAIGLTDGLRKIGKKSILALREPSLGPVFGIKGGATGGGYSQVAPMEDINLHFNGDIHAITSANNLLSALIDNHIYYGNELQFDKVIWKRCVDLNDRQLRKVETGLSGEKYIVPREDGFDISVASEIMAILCLATDIKDLKRRIGNIIVGYNKNGKPITARDLHAEGSLTVLLKDAIKPNLVQTLEHTPALIHGGPFANIAHGCNSVIATKTAMKLGDYVVTEAGFGSDLGAEKFLDIKCRKAGIKPDAVVCVATIRALKYHGGQPKEEVEKENLEALKNGIKNLNKHIENLKDKFGLNAIVAINKFPTDTVNEINLLKSELENQGVNISLAENHQKGGEGIIDLANKVVELAEKAENFKYIYDDEDAIETKIEKVAKNIYGASGVEYSEKAIEEIRKIDEMGYSKYPVCIAKTQYSFSDDPKNLECKEEFKIHVNEIQLKAGAEFIVAITGKIMTMPGLPRVPAAENIDIDENGNIIGIF
ncbi:MAG: formate--tetrahydrofolate ligase [Christensenellales bacterium]